MSLPARTVLVTGSAKRLGREIALALAAAGWQVAVHYRQSEDDALQTVADCEQFGAAAAFDADLADEAAVHALLPRVVTHFGEVDAVINCAAIFEHDSAASFGYAAMEKHLRTNTGAAILLAQALHAHVRERAGEGVVVNLLDQKLWNQNPDFLSYTLSKAALEAASKLLAQALAPALRVCGVAPGVTLPSGPMSEQEFAQAHRMTPLERSSTPQDVASAVRFLLESPAMTGSTLLVDGGQHLSPQPRDVLFLVRQQK